MVQAFTVSTSKMMKMQDRLLLVVFLITLTGCVVECSNVCKDIMTKSAELQLKTHLFCDYDPNVRPETGKNNTINVGMTIMPKIIEFDDMTNTLSVHCWTAMNWTDPLLSWNPTDFDSVDTLHVPSSDLWIPDIKVQNSGDASDVQEMPDTDCNLFRDGSIICVPAMKYTAHCDSDYTYYPYDLQNCKLELSSWSYSADEVNLRFSHGVVMSDYKPNQEWKVLETTATTETRNFKLNETHVSSVYSIRFVLQRRGAGMHMVYVAPAMVLVVLTLTVLWLDCYSTERMIVASISFICHLLCIQDLYFSIPYNGAVSPNILRFYENSLLLTGLSLMLTVLLRELRSVRSKAPNWLSYGVSLLLRSRAGQLLLLSILDPKASAFLERAAEDNADLVLQQQPQEHENQTADSSTWAYVTLLLGWLTFVLTFFLYAVMLVVFLPSSTVTVNIQE